MGRTVSNVSLEPRLATVDFISVDGMQSHSVNDSRLKNMWST